MYPSTLPYPSVRMRAILDNNGGGTEGLSAVPSFYSLGQNGLDGAAERSVE